MKTLDHQQDRSDLTRRLTMIRPDATPLWGKMSAHQMVCHLSDSFRIALGRKPVRDASGPLRKTLVKWTALYLPLPWPRGLVTVPEVDQQIGGTAPGQFATDLDELAELLALLHARDRTSEWPPHPIFGRMSRSAWLRWGYLHTDHHLRQFGV
jgi:uncharacterized protein DUF1569